MSYNANNNNSGSFSIIMLGIAIFLFISLQRKNTEIREMKSSLNKAKIEQFDLLIKKEKLKTDSLKNELKLSEYKNKVFKYRFDSLQKVKNQIQIKYVETEKKIKKMTSNQLVSYFKKELHEK